MIRMSDSRKGLSLLLDLKIKIFDNEIEIHEYLCFLQLKYHGNHVRHEKRQLLLVTAEKLVEYN